MDEYLLYCIDRLQRIVDGSGYYFDSAGPDADKGLPMMLSEMALSLIEDMDTSTYRIMGTKEQAEWWNKQLEFRRRFDGCGWIKPSVPPEIPKELMNENGGWKYPSPSPAYHKNREARLLIIAQADVASKL